MEANKKILVAYADDHVSVRTSIISSIEQAGNIRVIVEGDNGNELIENIGLAPVQPDVCLIDLEMPGMNGFNLLPLIKKRWPVMGCIVYTAYGLDSYVSEMYRNGANGYLLKTCAVNEIITAINEVYHVGSYHSELTLNVRSKVNEMNLSEREIEFLRYVPTDLSYADIAVRMKTTYKTIEGLRDRLCLKLSVKTRSSLIVLAIQLGYFIIPNYKKQMR